MIGFSPGTTLLHRAHPYTPLTAAGAIFVSAFALGTPPQAALIVLAAVVFAALGGAVGRALRPALVLAVPVWALLLVVHGLKGPEPFSALGPVVLSEPGFARALVLGARVTAILIASVTVLHVVSPDRLTEAMTARGAPFGRIYLLVSTLTLVPRLRERAGRILEAQQCRGLRLGGSPLARARALGPLVLPLVLGALAEVDEQVFALDARGVTRSGRRTPLWPPDDPAVERLLRVALVLVVVVLYGARFLGYLA